MFHIIDTYTVPVDTPSEMYGTDVDGKKWGKLYSFTSSGNSALNWTEPDGKISITATSGSGSYREPDVGTYWDGDTTYLTAMNNILNTSSSEFLADLETDFNSMVNSVIKYKGFYVGRYETSLNASGVAQSKQGETSAYNSSADTNWYGLYARQKLYSTDSVQGSMIWGSQYDAMMKWMQGNGINVSFYLPTDLSIGVTSRNTTRVTGGENEDKISNIYDLLGNSYDWTLEANDTNGRVIRGGNSASSYSPQRRYDSYPSVTGSDYCSRLALYVKWH